MKKETSFQKVIIILLILLLAILIFQLLINRKLLTYQNGSTTLKEAYFDFNDPLKLLSETSNGISLTKNKKSNL